MNMSTRCALHTHIPIIDSNCASVDGSVEIDILPEESSPWASGCTINDDQRAIATTAANIYDTIFNVNMKINENHLYIYAFICSTYYYQYPNKCNQNKLTYERWTGEVKADEQYE